MEDYASTAPIHPGYALSTSALTSPEGPLRKAIQTSYDQGIMVRQSSLIASKEIPNHRKIWLVALTAIIIGGVLSRTVHSGLVLIDKYLGDALYAVMVYSILRLFRRRAAVAAMGIMTALELFQLTLIPAHLLASPHWCVRMLARLMGTEFSFLDLAAYAVGILSVCSIDRRKTAAQQLHRLY